MRARVTNWIIGCAKWLSGSHQVDDKCSAEDEKNFHEGIVDADEVHKKVKISYTEDD